MPTIEDYMQLASKDEMVTQANLQHGLECGLSRDRFDIQTLVYSACSLQ